MQGGIKETAYQIHVENKEFDVIATLDTDSKKANDVAKLIAAAPELLQALQGLLDAHAIPSSICKEKPAHDAAKLAISKATGEKA